ncbi:MAG: MarR family winged helix-turn-helix transcriptional regulator [Oscillospiraceae bacterium]
MYYEALADELMNIKADLLRVPASQQLSKIVKGEMFVLEYLNRHDGIIHPKELSENMAVSTARISSLLNKMEEKKLIVRKEDPQDSRQIIVELTPEGTKMSKEERERVIEHVAQMLERLGPEDAEEYIRIQKKIIRSFFQEQGV